MLQRGIGGRCPRLALIAGITTLLSLSGPMPDGVQLAPASPPIQVHCALASAKSGENDSKMPMSVALLGPALLIFSR